MIHPTLALTTLLSLALAVVFYVRARRAERRVLHLTAAKDLIHKRAWAAEDQLVESQEKAADLERKWRDARQRYLDSLDEIAELRAGGTGDAAE